MATISWETIRAGKKLYVNLLFIVAIPLIVFFGKINGQFLGDDFLFTKKASVFAFSTQSLIDLGLFTETGFFYRPAAIAVWVVFYKLFGLSAGLYHAGILGFHILNCVLLFILLVKIGVEERISFLSACTFSIFTGHIGAIQWLSGIFDILCSTFVLLSLLFLSEFLTRKNAFSYLLCLAAALAALLSKETGIVLLPLALLSIAVVRAPKPFKYDDLALSIKMVVPLAVLHISYFIVRSEFLKKYGVDTPRMTTLSLTATAWNYYVMVRSLIFPHPALERWAGPLAYAVGGFVLVIALTFYLRKASRIPLIFGVGWILLTALPAAIVLQQRAYPASDLVASRFNYLPSVGFCLILAQLLVAGPVVSSRKKLVALLPAVVLFVYSINTVHHSRYWKGGYRVSEMIQTHFLSDILPILDNPARVYLYGIPEDFGRVGVFFKGIPECFSLLSGSGDMEFYHAQAWFAPYLNSPEAVKVKPGLARSFFFEWDNSEERFRRIDCVAPEQQSAPKKIVSWDFADHRDFRQWEPANEIVPLFEHQTRSHKFMTTGDFSFLKSPFLNHDNVRYVQITYSARCPGIDFLEGRLLWVTAENPTYENKKSIRFKIQNDGLTHTYTIPLFVNGWFMRDPHIRRIAIRPSNHPGTLIWMKSVVLYN